MIHNLIAGLRYYLWSCPWRTYEVWRVLSFCRWQQRRSYCCSSSHDWAIQCSLCSAESHTLLRSRNLVRIPLFLSCTRGWGIGSAVRATGLTNRPFRHPLFSRVILRMPCQTPLASIGRIPDVQSRSLPGEFRLACQTGSGLLIRFCSLTDRQADATERSFSSRGRALAPFSTFQDSAWPSLWYKGWALQSYSIPLVVHYSFGLDCCQTMNAKGHCFLPCASQIID